MTDAPAPAAPIDLTALPLRKLLTTDLTALDVIIDRVVNAAEKHPQKSVSAFNSAV